MLIQLYIWDSCLRWFVGVNHSQMFIQTKTSSRLDAIAGLVGHSTNQYVPPA